MSPADFATRVPRRRRLIGGFLLALFIGVPAVVLGLVSLLGSDDDHGARTTSIRVLSPGVGGLRSTGVIEPPGDREGRPLLVFLHGRGESYESYLDNGALLAALARQRRAAPVIAVPDGGESSYWHNREGGDWADYVVDDVIPRVTKVFGTDPDRVAIGGISMGGFGAYSLALSNPGRFCAVGGHSPALWLDGGDSAPGAFDDAEDFERHDVLEQVDGSSKPFGGIPVWNDIGEEDPFLISSVELTDSLRERDADLTAHLWPGGHEGDYWDSHWDEYLRFYADALAACG